MQLNIEVGKKYKTRCGNIWTAAAHNPTARESDRWIGWDNEGNSVSYYENGNYLVIGQSNYDLMSEYKETVKKYQVLYYNVYRERFEIDYAYYTSIEDFNDQWSDELLTKPQLIMESVKEFEV